MDLVDLIEKRRFVGREFLVWLWFESELFESRFDLKDLGASEIWLEGQITLVQEKEQSRLKGAAPSAAPEAYEALRQGKLPTQARVRVARGELEYAFLFNADTLGLSAIKIPSVMKEEADEQFYERMFLIEELEAQLGALYGEFLALRLSTAWDSVIAPDIRAWIRSEPVDSGAYRKIRDLVAPIGGLVRREQLKSSPPPADTTIQYDRALAVA